MPIRGWTRWPIRANSKARTAPPMTDSAEHRPSQPLSLCQLTSQVARDCLGRLGSPGALSDETTVHEMRVATKRLRAAWRLVRCITGRGLEKSRSHALGELSAKLSGVRDLTVLTRLTQSLAATQTDGRIALALDHVVTALLRKHDDEALRSGAGAEGLIAELRTDWLAEIDAWDTVAAIDPDPHQLRRAIRHELRRSLRRARRDTRESKRSLDPEWWHDWRKTVKRLRYQREFVALTQQRQPGKFDTRVHRLGSRLGERNDLANLAEFADTMHRDGQLSDGDHGLVRKAIADAERAIVGNCRRLGRQTFLR